MKEGRWWMRITKPANREMVGDTKVEKHISIPSTRRGRRDAAMCIIIIVVG
jgi:hypothetical protein